MSDTESVDYLQPGFDPASLTNPRLRSILVTYNVNYPSNAKKPELVELFNANVAPQASKILARRARAKRSSMGIVDAQTSASYSQSTTAFGDSFDQEPPQQLSPKKRRGRPSSHAATPHIDEHDEDEAEDAQRRQRRSSPRKRSSRQSSFQPPESTASYSVAGASDTDTGPEARTGVAAGRPPSRRARTKTPQVKLEPTEEEQFLATPAVVATGRNAHLSSADENNNTVFTYDNPFQSGSSPLSGSSPAQRRRTTNYDETASHKHTSTSTSGRVPSSSRKSRVVSSPAAQPAYDSPPIRAVAQRRNSPFAKAVSQSPEPEEEEEQSDEEDYDPLAPGEEFTPEEQLELTQQEEVQRRQNVGSNRRSGKGSSKAVTRRRRGFVSSLSTPLLVLFLTLLGLYGGWYRQEKRAVGFCGLGRLAVPLLSEQIEKLEWLPDWVRDIEIPNSLQVFIEPTCEPCPSHAFCYSDFTVRCENGYIEKPHPLALGGLVPLPPTCEPDGERARRVKAVADKAIEELRDRRAKWECGDLVDDEGQVPEDPAIDVPVLKEVISEKRSKKMSKEEFDDLWTAAIGDIESRDEVESEPDSNYAATDPGTVPNTRLSSTSLARLPLTCAVRRSIRLGLARHRLSLSVLILSLFGVAYLRHQIRARRADRARVPALVDIVLERLAAQKELWLYEDDFEGGGGGGGGGAGSGQSEDADDSSFLPDPFLFLPQLRDDVLRATHSLSARERIWKHVRAVVEQNSNVRTGQREGRNGEVGRAWEWIGPVGTASSVIANGSSAALNPLEMSAVRRRRSGRASLMPTGSGATSRAGSAAPRDSIGASRPGDVSDASTGEAQQPQKDGPAGNEHRSALHKRWQESRPFY
ncbi:sister chromatid separation protein [Sporothrix brasiliensis 5110]|uniref:Sister chromatid separation protein n=1 Tax=Sporothrix brasiliensis 5110 TaxID=1398154 RepID=A0A0C2IJ02_9PEZI|nr:sister chromatid separation protein [Sporothrix brasiliensis 5110]KIH86970.1 sister chromatid separation protein [Sporothrix brasiliensis 5110]